MACRRPATPSHRGRGTDGESCRAFEHPRKERNGEGGEGVDRRGDVPLAAGFDERREDAELEQRDGGGGGADHDVASRGPRVGMILW